MKNKQYYRDLIKNKFQDYRLYELKSKSKVILPKVIKLVRNKSFKTIFCYVSLEDEVFTSRIIQYFLENNYILLVPKIKGDKMISVEINSLNDLMKSKFGIFEPVSNTEFDGNIDIAILPGRCFTLNGDRIGRGFGYYDKFFSKSKNKDIYKVGVCFDFQILKEISVDSFDVIMNEVISN